MLPHSLHASTWPPRDPVRHCAIALSFCCCTLKAASLIKTRRSNIGYFVLWLHRANTLSSGLLGNWSGVLRHTCRYSMVLSMLTCPIIFLHGDDVLHHLRADAWHRYVAAWVCTLMMPACLATVDTAHCTHAGYSGYRSRLPLRCCGCPPKR